MGFMHIENAYRHPEFFANPEEREVWYLEKIHGTSAHVKWRREGGEHGTLTFFSGGEKHAISPDRITQLTEANSIAEEWVTEERLTHVLDHLRAHRENEDHRITSVGSFVERTGDFDLKDTPVVIREMLDDVKREAGAEVAWSAEANRACATRTAKLFKARVASLVA